MIALSRLNCSHHSQVNYEINFQLHAELNPTQQHHIHIAPENWNFSNYWPTVHTAPENLLSLLKPSSGIDIIVFEPEEIDNICDDVTILISLIIINLFKISISS